MNTIRLYQTERYLKECDAFITDISMDSDNFYITLNQTIFFPEGGGQSSDIGYIQNLKIDYVYEKDGEIIHRAQNNNNSIVPSVGDSVHCSIDWSHRFINMQRHCAEHILAGIFHFMYGGVNRGFHMGDDYMTLDINFENAASDTQLTAEMIDNVEAIANKTVWDNLPVYIDHYNTKEDASKAKVRKPLEFDEDITIVTIGERDNPADCVACCGTHPATTSEIGIIKIFKAESYKGMFRIYFEAGERALKYFQKYHNVLTDLTQKFSATIDDLTEKIQIQETKAKNLSTQLGKLKQVLIQTHIKEIEDYKNNLEKTGSLPRILSFSFDDLSIDDQLRIGRSFIGSLGCLLALSVKESKTLLLFSDGTPDCGKLVKENASIYQGKGGGGNNNARAIFPKEDYIDLFIDLLDKHLR